MNIKRKLSFKYNSIIGPLPKPQKWVFLVGCYNSGTTLLHNILANHPMIGSMPAEGQFYTDQFVLPKTVGYARIWALAPKLFYLDEDRQQNIDVNKLKRQWGARYNDPDRAILIEKSPTNAARVKWLQAHFENACFIGIVRNGYAVAEGINRKAGHSLELSAKQWRVSNEIMLRDFEQLSRKLLISYEALTKDSEQVTNDVFEFLELKRNNNRNLTKQVWRIHEQVSPIKNMNSLSFSALNAEDRRIITKEAGSMLNHLGYSIVE